MPNYEVTFKLYCVVAVQGAKDEDEAYQWAESETSFGNCEMEEATTVKVKAADWDAVKRHANYFTVAD